MSKATILENVQSILRSYPEARNNDTLIMFLYYREYCPMGQRKLQDALDVVYGHWDLLQGVAEGESITRARRVVQNELGMYPPTENVSKKRKLATEGHSSEWRVNKGGNYESRQ
tara:strand:- start:12616 stop:12957 length:342 start_codon:yes stop_codon:yes gene_type:complete